jgi:tRNA pseudouridine55 synthase
MDGFLNLNKPLGITSHDCVFKLRKILGTKKIGHAGTLDPAADGVLPVAIGRATRLLQYLPTDKAYNATVRFGLVTETDDLEGAVIQTADASQLAEATVVQALAQFNGLISQVPPSYSAIQVDGKRLYDLARSGQAVVAPTRQVMIYDIQVLGWRSGEQPEIDLAIACGAGTYIRSIARDLGTAVGTGATLSALRRTASSGFGLRDSFTLDDVAEKTAAQSLTIVSPEIALAHLPRVILTGDDQRRWRLGQKLWVDDLAAVLASGVPWPNASEIADRAATQPYRVDAETGDFLGITQIEYLESRWRLPPQMVYCPA